MTLQKASLALLLSFVIVFSFVTVIQVEKNSNFVNNGIISSASTSNFTQFGVLTYPTFSGSQIAYQDVVKESPVALINNSTTRAAVYDFIVANPGIQFRGICTGLSIAIGTAEFHLGVLKKAGLISFVLDGKYKRFFVSKKFSMKEMKLISLLRHETIKEIVKKIIAEKAVPHSKLASYLCITSQGLTWQIDRLREEGIIKENSNGIKVTYSLNEVYIQELPELLYRIEQ